MPEFRSLLEVEGVDSNTGKEEWVSPGHPPIHLNVPIRCTVLHSGSSPGQDLHFSVAFGLPKGYSIRHMIC